MNNEILEGMIKWMEIGGEFRRLNRRKPVFKPNIIMSKEFKWTDAEVKKILHAATGNIKDFVMNEDGFLEDYKASHSTEAKREWEIESFWCEKTKEYHVIHLNGLYTSKKARGGYASDLATAISNPNFSIHSVRRLSDGEIFTVGDRIEFDGFGGLQSAAIHRFEVNYFEPTQISAYNSAYGLGCQRWKKTPQRTKLFTTEDGKELFAGDVGYLICDRTVHAFDLKEGDRGYWKETKWFSTKESAEEFILMNEPLLSVTDALSWATFEESTRATIIPKDIDRLKELAKSKL